MLHPTNQVLIAIRELRPHSNQCVDMTRTPNRRLKSQAGRAADNEQCGMPGVGVMPRKGMTNGFKLEKTGDRIWPGARMTAP
ncbi:hypothetical protein [Caballeronia sp. GAWG1-5s-s]|jgi:hypothetical protein|uniref:hypothetical protein n=1 Tax=Caballeronia sp. GAWG1-5s-s TaxID=2921743 RepID=UPI0020299391|nr:hypothetical protein [Caballeronia sp. GAWG1-5s-s]